MVKVKIDKRLLIHSFDYREYVGEDRNHQPEYKESQLIENVRVDFGSDYSRDGDQVRLTSDAVIFVYSGYSTPFPDFKKQSIIVFKGEKYTLKRVEPVYNLYDDSLFAYELEVL